MLIVAKCCTCQQKCHTQPRSKGRTPSKHELYRRPPQTSSEMLSPPRKKSRSCTNDPRGSCTNHPHPSPGTTFPGPSMSSEAATSRSHLLAKLKTRRLWEVHPCMITRDMEQLSDHNLSCLSFMRLYFEWKNIEKWWKNSNLKLPVTRQWHLHGVQLLIVQKTFRDNWK